jgi:hypothetical protein
MESEWNSAQTWERNWWMTARSQHESEIVKNNFVARMLFIDKGLPTKTVIDIGCGPLSLLQRIPVKSGTGLDPIHYGDLEELYASNNIRRIIKCGEDLDTNDGMYDEAWIYNCLQHVKNPISIIKNAMKVAKVVRIFEWTYIKPYEGHLHELTPELLTIPFQIDNWRTLMTATGKLNHSGLNGDYFIGIFSKDNDELDT